LVASLVDRCTEARIEVWFVGAQVQAVHGQATRLLLQAVDWAQFRFLERFE
jgi:hypothetical protein